VDIPQEAIIGFLGELIGLVVMKDKLNRDEMFFRIAHIETGLEKKETILNDMKKIKNPNFQDLEGTSYLHLACQEHSIETIKILLDLGADPSISDCRGFSPVMNALVSKNEKNKEILELMLQHGLDINKMEGKRSLKERIGLFKDSELNAIMAKYSNQEI